MRLGQEFTAAHTPGMREKEACKILRALIEGSDPATGQSLPPETVLRRLAVQRALLLALTTLEDNVLRTERRAQLPGKVGQLWSAAEDAVLLRAFKTGRSFVDIAAQHQRTARGVEARLQKLGLVVQRRTRAQRGGR
jgi:hypothetical protein